MESGASVANETLFCGFVTVIEGLVRRDGESRLMSPLEMICRELRPGDDEENGKKKEEDEVDPGDDAIEDDDRCC